MPALIRCSDNKNQPIVTEKNGTLSQTYFNLIRLARNEEYRGKVEGFETVYVVLSGKVDIEVNGKLFKGVGQRKDLWSGKADSVYATTGADVRILARDDGTEVAVSGGRCRQAFPPFRVLPEEVETVNVGSNEAHAHRRILHILGHNAAGRAGNLLVSELYADPGCWSGYPPHKHDEEWPPEETAFEELYHYRFRPETGFGAQLCFQPDGSSQCFLTRNGDTFLLDRGYHPTVTSPGHEECIFTVLVGKHQRSLIQNFKEEHRHLLSGIPGLQDMVDKFK